VYSEHEKASRNIRETYSRCAKPASQAKKGKENTECDLFFDNAGYAYGKEQHLFHGSDDSRSGAAVD
jgi:hypothetical protein